MDHLKPVRNALIKKLWEKYRLSVDHAALVDHHLKTITGRTIILDHFALIDLPSAHTGIPTLSAIFSEIGFTQCGADYLPDKQNDFIWMASIDAPGQPAELALPQVVLADFRLEELPPPIKKIILQYTAYIKPSPINEIKKQIRQLSDGDCNAIEAVVDLIYGYIMKKDWPLPTIKEFRTVQEYNELLAWVLVFGSIPNHFAASMHFSHPHFQQLDDLNAFLRDKLNITLNTIDGEIKGSREMGIRQSSTLAPSQKIALSDGEIMIPSQFMEFVWRFSMNEKNPVYWDDYYTGFIAKNANRVVESLYT